MAEEQKPLSRIRTLETDIEIRKRSGVSPADMVAKTGTFANEQQRINTRKILMATVAAIIVGGAAFGLFKYFSPEKPTKEEKSATTQIGKSFIKVDLEKIINFSSSDPNSLVSAIKKELETKRKSDSLLFFILPQTFREFSQFTGIKIPESVLQNSHPSFNIFTAYHAGSSSIVFLIKIENFEKAYGSLLSWEKDMWQSFSQFISAGDINNINRFSFSDEIIRNHDSRVLINQEGKEILAYAIFNKQYVVIATSREALSMLLQRFIASPPK